jgi:predicted nuclease of predicted toxin-antitoxin system
VKILIDMNLTPAWVEYLAHHGIDAQHWSTLGDPKAKDETIMAHARASGMVVFTHDLDFGNILAVTHARGPSVIQVRTEDPVPSFIGEMLVASIREYEHHLRRGALLTVEPDRLRGRLLPLVPGIRV